MEFRKYPHLERIGNTEVDGIEVGQCYIFPKLDGTNAQVWLDGNGQVRAGSRNRNLELSSDNAGFYNWAVINQELKDWLWYVGRQYAVYGEWLVPHTLKTYRDDAWSKFYIFDILDRETGKFLHFNEQLKLFGTTIRKDFKLLHPLQIINNPTTEMLLNVSERNTYAIKDGEGVGEGIVIKNYDFQNKFGRVTWAKLVRNEFKEAHISTMGANEISSDIIEGGIVDKYLTQVLVDKTYDKIRVENEGWTSKLIPQLLGRVYHDLITEELWNIIKEYKQPKIDFKLLERMTIMRIKKLRQDLF